MPRFRISTLLVDDNPAFLRSTERFLAVDESIVLVGRAHSGAEALEQARDLNPDLILMDVVMPGMSGLEATRRLKERPAAPRVVLVTLHDGPETRDAAARVQADAVIGKAEMGEGLLPLIHALCPLVA